MQTKSKSMDLNDFLIQSNTLNIGMSRNLFTEPQGDRFREYTVFEKEKHFFAWASISLT